MSNINITAKPFQSNSVGVKDLKSGQFYKCISYGPYYCWLGQACYEFSRTQGMFLNWLNGKGFVTTNTGDYHNLRFVEIDVEIKEV